MRRLYVSAALIALLAALSGLHIWHLNDLTGQLTAMLTQAQELAEQEDWEKEWDEDIDAILISLDETLAFLEGAEKQTAEYAASNARLITQLGLLVEAELPTITNLL